MVQPRTLTYPVSLLIGLSLALALLLPAGSDAAPRVAVDPQLVPRGERAVIKGIGWVPGSRVSLRIGLPQSESYAIGRFTANSRGRFAKRLAFRGLPGLYVITACRVGSCGRVQRTLVRIVSPARAQTTLLHSDLPRSRYAEQPRRLSYLPYTTAAQLRRIGFTGLRWRQWGKGTARATGQARICTAAGCRSMAANLTATRRVRYESREWFYATLRVKLGKGKASRQLALCTLPAICGGRPGPP